MPVLDDDDLDDEDRAILAELSKKGYYHGRPKSEVDAPCPPSGENAPVVGRSVFDDFQRKWEAFDKDEFIEELAEKLKVSGSAADDFLKDLIDPVEDEPACDATVGASRPAEASGKLTTAASKLPTAAKAKAKAKAWRHPLPGRRFGPKSLALRSAAQCALVHTFKVVVAGDDGVGKRSMLQWLFACEMGGSSMSSHSRVPTFRLSFRTNCGAIDFLVTLLQSKDRHRRSPDCIGAQGAILMFNPSEEETFRSVREYRRGIVRCLHWSVPTSLVASLTSKAKAEVPNPLVRTYCDNVHLQYHEVDKDEGLNSELPFQWLARRLANQPALRFVGNVAHMPTVNLAQSEEVAANKSELQASLRVPL